MSMALLAACRRRNLLNHPQLWLTRFCFIVPGGLAAVLLAAGLALTFSTKPGKVGDPEAYLAWLLFGAALASGYWAYLQLRQQRVFSFHAGVGGLGTFYLNVLCLVIINLAPYVFVAHATSRLTPGPELQAAFGRIVTANTLERKVRPAAPRQKLDPAPPATPEQIAALETYERAKREREQAWSALESLNGGKYTDKELDRLDYVMYRGRLVPSIAYLWLVLLMDVAMLISAARVFPVGLVGGSLVGFVAAVLVSVSALNTFVGTSGGRPEGWAFLGVCGLAILACLQGVVRRQMSRFSAGGFIACASAIPFIPYYVQTVRQGSVSWEDGSWPSLLIGAALLILASPFIQMALNRFRATPQ